MIMQRGQFSMRHILIVVLTISVPLALLVQVREVVLPRHMLLVVVFFASGIAFGWRAKNWRMLLASSTAMLVFAASYLACWIQLGNAWELLEPRMRIQKWEIQSLADAISQYHQQQGGYPDALADVAEIQGGSLRFNASGQLLDAWDQPYSYQKTDDGFTLASLGRDGQPGGSGLNADIYSGDEAAGHSSTRLPLFQFLFGTRGSPTVFWSAFVASLASGAVWFLAGSRRRESRRALFVAVATTVASAVLVSSVLAALYLMTQDSGH